jgi:S-adenosylmethionine-diacylglycerol 3-amino-3-carboxypropyl transferase
VVSVQPLPLPSTAPAGVDPSPSELRVTQGWEDVDILLDGLDVRAGDRCFAVSGAADVALSMLAYGASQVVAIDRSQAQLALLELKAAAFRTLNHPAMLELVGARPSSRRSRLYGRAREVMSDSARAFWDARTPELEIGVVGVGRVEQSLARFRRFVVGAAHSQATLRSIFEPRSPAERRRFHRDRWANWRWRVMLRAFASESVARWVGFESPPAPGVEVDSVDILAQRIEHMLVELDPRENPYLHWLLFGHFGDVLPHPLRFENFEPIQSRLNRLRWERADLQEHLRSAPLGGYDRLSLSTAYEGRSDEERYALRSLVARSGRPGARAASWRVRRPRAIERAHPRLRPLPGTSDHGTRAARNIFSSEFLVEEVRG